MSKQALPAHIYPSKNIWTQRCDCYNKAHIFAPYLATEQARPSSCNICLEIGSVKSSAARHLQPDKEGRYVLNWHCNNMLQPPARYHMPGKLPASSVPSMAPAATMKGVVARILTRE